MIHKCDYAIIIGATAKWITDSEDGREVCMFCSEPKETRPIIEDNIVVPQAKRVTRTTPRK